MKFFKYSSIYFSRALFFVFIFLSCRIFSQPILMTTEAGNFDNGRSVAADRNGNIYVTGSFLSDTLILDSTILKTNGNQDLFLAKYSPLGKILWARSIGGIGDEKGLSLAIDSKENIFVTGCFSASFKYDSLNITNKGLWDIFIVKYDSTGNLRWVKTAGGKGDDYGQGICVDTKDNIYVAGSFSCQLITLSDRTLSNSSDKAGSFDMCLLKYNNEGNLLWAKNAGGKTDDGGMSIAADIHDNIYVAGYFESAALTFGFNIIKNDYSGRGTIDAYLVKYDSDGNAQWAKSFGSRYDDGALSVCTDKDGNVFISGNFENEIMADTTALISHGISDIFIIKYNSSGSVVWAKNFGDINEESGLSLCSDKNGNIYMTGFFNSEEISFGTIKFTLKNKSDIYLVKFDPAGNIKWAKHSGGSADEAGLGICSDGNGNIVMTGYFESGILPFEAAVLNKKSVTDVFISKYTSEGKNLWAKNSEGRGGVHRQKIENEELDNTLVGRILFNKAMDEGVAGAKVVLLNDKGKIIKSTTADDYGVFIFKNVSDAANIAVKITGDVNQFFNQRKIYLANVDNTVISAARKGKNDFFVFGNLTSEWKMLPPLVEKDSVNKFSFSGNIYAGEEHMPVKNLKTYLVDEKGEVVQSVLTNAFGSFTFANIAQEGKYTVKIDSTDKRVSASTIYFTNERGKIIASDNGRIFRFEFLSSDKNTLALLQVNDAGLIADVRGKICSDANGKKPIAGCKVKVINGKGDEIGKAFTDSLGNFWISGVKADEYYILKLEESGAVLKLNEIFVSDENGKMIGKLKSGEGKFFRFEFLPMEDQSLNKIYFEDTDSNSLFNGKLLSNSKTEQGIPNTKVSLLNPDGTILQTIMSDEKGMFLFKNIPDGIKFNVKVYENDSLLINQDKIYLADKTNRIVSKIVKGENGFFVFQNLPSQLSKLTTFVEKDTSIQISFSGNIYAGDERMPVENLKILLIDDKGNVIQTSSTNSFGSFTFTNILSDKKYSFVVDSTDKRVTASTIYFTNKKGTLISSGIGRNFRYELLSENKSTISQLQVKDAELLADIHGKLCSDPECKNPVSGGKLKVINEKGEEMGKAITDSLGNFWITGVKADEYYVVKLEESENVLKLNEIFISDGSGKMMGKLKSAEGKFFRFEFLPMDKQNFSAIYVDDPWLKVAKLQAQAKKDSIFIIENIYYEYRKWDLLPAAYITQNKVVDVMKKNPDISIEIISHTDSRGADDFNLTLSQKRAASAVNYIASKGINKKRIVGKGMGESHLLNNCDDGVDCSEDEHAKNRRTEFKITKNIQKKKK